MIRTLKVKRTRFRALSKSSVLLASTIPPVGSSVPMRDDKFIIRPMLSPSSV